MTSVGIVTRSRGNGSATTFETYPSNMAPSLLGLKGTGVSRRGDASAGEPHDARREEPWARVEDDRRVGFPRGGNTPRSQEVRWHGARRLAPT